jgi:DUF1009 family protein
MQPSSPPTELPRLGIIAGGGALPGEVARAAEAAARPVFIAALTGECDAATVVGRDHAWIDIAAIGALLDHLRRANCRDVVMAGRVGRPDLRRLAPDWEGVKLLPRVIKAMASGDDALLKTLVAFLEDKGFRVIGADEVAAGLVAPSGPLGRVAPSDADRADMARAVAVVRALGLHDVGQGAVVRDGLVLAVEAAEGTDAMLERCAALNGAERGGVLAKLPKPLQERRMDLPTIGLATLEKARAARLAGIAVEAGGALVLDRAALVASADAAGLFLYAFTPSEFVER